MSVCVAGSRIQPFAVGADVGAVLGEEAEAAAGEPAVEEDLVFLVGLVTNLGVLGQIRQNPAIADGGFDLGVESLFGQGLADGLGETVEAVAGGGGDGDGFVVVGFEDVEVGSVGDAVGLVEDEERGVVGEAELVEDALDGVDLSFGFGVGRIHHMKKQV